MIILNGTDSFCGKAEDFDDGAGRQWIEKNARVSVFFGQNAFNHVTSLPGSHMHANYSPLFLHHEKIGREKPELSERTIAQLHVEVHATEVAVVRLEERIPRSPERVEAPSAPPHLAEGHGTPRRVLDVHRSEILHGDGHAVWWLVIDNFFIRSVPHHQFSFIR